MMNLFLFLLFLPLQAPGLTRDPMKMASIRAEVTSRSGCDKYCWYGMRVLEVIGGRVESSTISVAAANSLPMAPNGEFLVALERYDEIDPSRWKVQEHPGKEVFRSTAGLNGLTSGQCRERGGRIEDDYDSGCSDKEVPLGTVLFMMCPCSCCAPSSQTNPHHSLKDLPPPAPTLYAGITDVKDWRNPFLTVETKGVRILRRGRIHPKELIAKLGRLHGDAWPYGRVIAIQDALPTGRLRKFETPVIETADVIRMLRDSGLEVVEWPKSK